MRKILIAAVLAAVLAPALHGQQGVVYKISDQGVKPPVVVKDVKPSYTPDAMRRKVQGVVEVEAVVLTDGTVGDVTVTRSLDPDLDEQAVKATKQWRFKPGTRDGQAVNVLVQIDLTFTLR